MSGAAAVAPVALISGAGSGVGRATALRLGCAGYAVACLDVRGETAEATAREVAAAGAEAWPVRVDVSDEASVRAGVAHVLDRAGRLDAVVSAAGVASISHATDLELSAWQRMLGVNLTGTFLLSRETLPALVESGGSLITVASVAGLRGWRYMAGYAATKGGVVALTRSLAVEYAGRGVRVNCICPGSVDTPMSAGLAPPEDADPELLGRDRSLLTAKAASAEEIAGAVSYLLSEDARFVTGSVHVIDGGILA